MDIEQISRLSIEKDFETLVQLLPPQVTDLTNADGKLLFDTVVTFHANWITLVTGQITLPDIRVKYEHSDNAQEEYLEGQDLWDQALLTVGLYYDFALRRLMQLGELPEGKDSIPGIHSKTYLELNQVKLPSTTTDNQLWALEFTSYYFNCLYSSCLLARVRQIDRLPQEPVQAIEYVPHASIGAMHELYIKAPEVSHQILALKLLESCIQHLARIYRDKWELAKEGHRAGIFSQIRLSELSLLAKRDAGLAEKYGIKHIEKLFERQLSLIFQSFGFYVISTRTGKRTVDLVCFSDRPEAKMTFMVEAKTTSRPYSLPTGDERALVDYISDVRSSLGLLPDLKFALILGYQPATTLERKLVNLEARVNIPVRFAVAQDIADLRESMPGPVPPDTFAKTILTNPHVIPSGFSQTIVQRYFQKQESLDDFVQNWIDPHGG